MCFKRRFKRRYPFCKPKCWEVCKRKAGFVRRSYLYPGGRTSNLTCSCYIAEVIKRVWAKRDSQVCNVCVCNRIFMVVNKPEGSRDFSMLLQMHSSGFLSSAFQTSRQIKLLVSWLDFSRTVLDLYLNKHVFEPQSIFFAIRSNMLQWERPILPRKLECNEIWDTLSVLEPTGIVCCQAHAEKAVQEFCRVRKRKMFCWITGASAVGNAAMRWNKWAPFY